MSHFPSIRGIEIQVYDDFPDDPPPESEILGILYANPLRKETLRCLALTPDCIITFRKVPPPDPSETEMNFSDHPTIYNIQVMSLQKGLSIKAVIRDALYLSQTFEGAPVSVIYDKFTFAVGPESDEDEILARYNEETGASLRPFKKDFEPERIKKLKKIRSRTGLEFL
jgi:hypothetical protein